MIFESFGENNKQTVILIHGAMWSRSLNKQKILSQNFHTVFVHMDGHGKEFDSRFEREKTVDDIVNYIKENKITRPHLVGFSLGSQICLMLADKYSHIFDKIALISPLVDAEESDISTIKLNMKAMAAAVKLRPLARIASSVLKLEKDLKEEFIEEMKNQSVTALAEDIMKERLNMTDLENISSIKNKFYIAVGRKDIKVFIESGKKLKKVLKNSVLSSFESCGHNIPITCHKRLNSELEMFFQVGV